jgi:heme oxygenase
LRAATQGPHERLHLHAGFSRVKNGTITLTDYRALLMRLYGFYRPFERAVGADGARARWLESDLAWLGADAVALRGARLCPDIPLYDSPERRLGALYVVEGSALGGRQLFRGLDGLLDRDSTGRDAIEGRRFFAGRGSETGGAWLDFLGNLAAVGSGPAGRAALVGAAVETFAVFETWLDGWSDRS